MSEWSACTHISILCTSPEDGTHQVPWNWDCRWLWVTTWVLGTEPSSFGGAPEPFTAEPSLQRHHSPRSGFLAWALGTELRSSCVFKAKSSLHLSSLNFQTFFFFFFNVDIIKQRSFLGTLATSIQFSISLDVTVLGAFWSWNPRMCSFFWLAYFALHSIFTVHGVIGQIFLPLEGWRMHDWAHWLYLTYPFVLFWPLNEAALAILCQIHGGYIVRNGSYGVVIFNPRGN